MDLCLACRSSTSSGGFFTTAAATVRAHTGRKKEKEESINGAPIIGAGAGPSSPPLAFAAKGEAQVRPVHHSSTRRKGIYLSIYLHARPANPTGHRDASRFAGPAPPSSRAPEVPCSIHMMLKPNTCPGKTTARLLIGLSVSELVLNEWRRTHSPAHCSLL